MQHRMSYRDHHVTTDTLPLVTFNQLITMELSNTRRFKQKDGRGKKIIGPSPALDLEIPKIAPFRPKVAC